MLSKLSRSVKSLVRDPWVLGAVGMMLLTRSFEVIGEQVTSQAALLQRQVAEAQRLAAVAVAEQMGQGAAAAVAPEPANGQAWGEHFQDPADKPAIVEPVE
jgi:hypothetical protein